MVRLLIHEKQLDPADKIQLILSYFLQVILLVAIILSAYRMNWLIAFLTLAILILTFVPALIRKNYKIYTPIEFDFFTVLFIFSSLFLGEIHAYYTKLWWWDIVLHTTAGILFGIFGFLLVYILNKEKHPKIHLEPGFIALFSFGFAIAIGSLWEIFEFFVDSTFGLNMQKSGLVDTMWDLIVNTLGALFVSILGYFYLKGEKSVIFSRMVTKFVEKNSQLRRNKKI